MNSRDELLIVEIMARTMEKFANHYTTNESMSKAEFFEIQIECVEKVKKDHGLK